MGIDILFGLVVLAGFYFSILNGTNNLTGLIASLIATRAAPVRIAQLALSFGMWAGIIVGSDAVARTVAVELITLDPHQLGTVTCLEVWLGAMIGALGWMLAARRLGVPTSTTHTVVGALCGAGVAGTLQLSLIQWGATELWRAHQIAGAMKVFAGLLLSPLLGFLLGFVIYRVLLATLKRRTWRVNTRLRRLELLAVLAQSFTYGLNDAHIVMGLLTGACISMGMVSEPQNGFLIPLQVKLLVACGLTVGVRFGSSNMLRSMGRGLFHMHPAEAFAGQVAGALCVLGASQVGAPVSSTQVASSALIGVGGAWRPRHVRWQKVREILMSWLVTFPAAALVAATFTILLRLLPF